MGLPKAHRLPRVAFEAVYRQGKRFSGKYFRAIVLFLPEEQTLAAPQFGVVVSKKVSKRAVHRNRLRRQVQAAFLQLLPHLRPGWQAILTVQNEALGCTYAQILPELEKIFKKAEVFDGYP